MQVAVQSVVPRSLRSVERKLARPAAVVELIHARLAELPTEAELVSTLRIRNNVREVARNVIAAFWRGKSDLFKPYPPRRAPRRAGNNNVGSPENGLALNGCVRT